MELKDLVGEGLLDGVDFSNEDIKSDWGEGYEDSTVCRFRLNGIIYNVIEDPNDGYRSSMKDLTISNSHKMKNVFDNVSVICKHRTDGEYGDIDDILEIVDAKTGKNILEVGTSNIDDYYPSYVADFRPENMILNQGGKENA